MPTLAVGGGGERGTVFAFRTSVPEATLQKAVGSIADGALVGRYPERRRESVRDRPVVSLRGSGGSLFVAVQAGLVAVSDHPLALGIVFRGMEGGAPSGPGGPRMTVRLGRGDVAVHGTMGEKRESVALPLTGEPLLAPVPSAPAPFVTIATSSVGDSPLLPAPPPDWVEGMTESLGSGSFGLSYAEGGAVAVSGLGASPITSQVAGRNGGGGGGWVHVRGGRGAAGVSATRAPGTGSFGGWLRAVAMGRLPSPFAAVDSRHVADAVTTTLGASAGGSPRAWTAGATRGRLEGPAFHGPATFLALRVLHDMFGTGDAGGGDDSRLPPPTTSAPLPPPGNR